MDGNSNFLPLLMAGFGAVLLAIWLLLLVLNLRQRTRARTRRLRNGANISAWNWVRKRTRVLRIGFQRSGRD